MPLLAVATSLLLALGVWTVAGPDPGASATGAAERPPAAPAGRDGVPVALAREDVRAAASLAAAALEVAPGTAEERARWLGAFGDGSPSLAAEIADWSAVADRLLDVGGADHGLDGRLTATSFRVLERDDDEGRLRVAVLLEPWQEPGDEVLLGLVELERSRGSWSVSGLRPPRLVPRGLGEAAGFEVYAAQDPLVEEEP